MHLLVSGGAAEATVATAGVIGAVARYFAAVHVQRLQTRLQRPVRTIVHHTCGQDGGIEPQCATAIAAQHEYLLDAIIWQTTVCITDTACKHGKARRHKSVVWSTYA